MYISFMYINSNTKQDMLQIVMGGIWNLNQNLAEVQKPNLVKTYSTDRLMVQQLHWM